MRRLTLLIAYALAGAAAISAAAPATPTFLARRDYLGLNSYWAQVADVNGDGVPDLLANFLGIIQVLLGNGKGSFAPGPTTHTNVLAETFAAAALTGGSTTDIVLVGQEEGASDNWGIGVCLGNGDGTFQTATFYGAGTNSSEDLGPVVIGDFNGDGSLDAVTVGASGIWLFAGKGDGTFNPGVLAVSLPAGAGGNIAAADFNGDGNLDLALTVANELGPSPLVVLFGNGNGTFQPPITFSKPESAGSLAVGALTKGGPPSIAVTGSDNTVYVYLGNGAGAFSGPYYAELPVTGRGGLAIADVNGDGNPDLVSDGADVAFGNGKGGFGKPVPYTVDGFGYNVVAADLRNNGLTDIVVSTNNAVSVLLNKAKGTYEDGGWTPVTGGAGCGAAADYNGDGKPDLAVNTPTGITILLGTGNAASPFSTGSTITTPGTPGCPVEGDLNGDGIPDLVVGVNGNPNAVLAYLGNGDGTFTLAGTTPTPDSGGYIVLADFNNDGNLDFATSGNLLALGNGNGTFQTPAPFVSSPPSEGFAFIAVGDLNGDGWPDLALTDPYQNLIYTLVNDQAGGFTQNAISEPAGTVPGQIVLADLEGNGYADAVVGTLYGSALIYVGNGRGGLFQKGSLTDPIIGITDNPVVVADVNGDGIPDVLMLEANTVGIFLGEGKATFAPQVSFGLGPAPGSILVEDLHGQSPTAGIPDIVAPDGSGGVTVLINETKRK